MARAPQKRWSARSKPARWSASIEYLTYWGLWARKSGKLPPVEDNDAMERGRRLEPVAVDMIRDRYPTWDVVVPPREHYADHEFGIGATPDLIVHDPERGQGVIQIKSLRHPFFGSTWRGESDAVKVPDLDCDPGADGGRPDGIEMGGGGGAGGRSWNYTCISTIFPCIRIVETIKTEALAFWQLVLSGAEPDPDYQPRRRADPRRAVGRRRFRD